MERTIAYGELVNRLRLVEQRRGNEKRKSELRFQNTAEWEKRR